MQPGEGYNQPRLIKDVYFPGEGPNRSVASRYLLTPIGRLYDVWNRRYHPDRPPSGGPTSQRMDGEKLLDVYTPPGILEAWPVHPQLRLLSGFSWIEMYSSYISARLTPALKGIALAAAGTMSRLITRFQTLRLTLPFRAKASAMPATVPMKYSLFRGITVDWQASPYYRLRRVIMPIAILVCAGILALIVWLTPQPHAGHQPLPHISIIPFPPPNPPGIVISKTATSIPGISAPFIAPFSSQTGTVVVPSIPTPPVSLPSALPVSVPSTQPVGQTVQNATQQVIRTTQTIEQAVTNTTKPVTPITQPVTQQLNQALTPPQTVTQTLPSVTQPVAPQITNSTAPIAQTVTSPAQPITRHIAPITAPVVQTLQPVIQPVAQNVQLPGPQTVAPTVKPVAQPVQRATQPLIDVVKPVIQPVTHTASGNAGPVTAPVQPVAQTVKPVTDTVTPTTPTTKLVMQPITHATVPTVAPMAPPVTQPTPHGTPNVATTPRSPVTGANSPITTSAPLNTRP